MKTRRLGNVEQVTECLNRRAGTWNVVTISRVQGALSPTILQQALDLAQQHHPALKLRIVGALSDLWFETDESIQIPLRVVYKSTISQWQEVAHEELNQKIESDRGLLRVVLVKFTHALQLSYLLTTLHHAVCDGLSSIHLHSEILTYCQKISAKESFTPPPGLPAPITVESLLSKTHAGIRARLKALYFPFWLISQKIRYRPQHLAIDQKSAIAERRSVMIHKKLSPALTRILIQCCQKNQVTVQGALCAAMLLAVADVICGDRDRKIFVSCQSFISLRNRLEPEISHESLMGLASWVRSFHQIRPNPSFWDIAREVKQALEKGIQHQDIFSVLHNAKLLNHYCFTHPQEVVATATVSNLGKVTIPATYGNFELEEISFAGSHNLFVGVFAVNAVTFQDTLLLNFLFSEPSLSRKTLEPLCSRVLSYLTYFV